MGSPLPGKGIELRNEELKEDGNEPSTGIEEQSEEDIGEQDLNDRSTASFITSSNELLAFNVAIAFSSVNVTVPRSPRHICLSN